MQRFIRQYPETMAGTVPDGTRGFSSWVELVKPHPEAKWVVFYSS
jgi:hypothetical protein